MARGDPVFMRVDIDKVLNGEKVSTLPPVHFKVYMVLWALAVKGSSYVLTQAISRPQYILDCAHLGGVSVSSRRRFGCKSVLKVLNELHELALIELLPSGRINVIGVKDVHKRLKWEKAPENLPVSIPTWVIK